MRLYGCIALATLTSLNCNRNAMKNSQLYARYHDDKVAGERLSPIDGGGPER